MLTNDNEWADEGESGNGVVESPLDVLFRYHIQEKHLPPGREVLAGQLALVFIAAAGLLYIKPAADFANHENLGLNKDAQVLFNVISTCYSAFVVLCAATVFFYRFHIKPQEIPTELTGIIEPPFTTAEYVRKNMIIGAASACSAVPFATLAYVSYQSLSGYELYPLVLYIFFANTFLHFLPIKLILDDPLYGAAPRYVKKLVLDCLDLGVRQKASVSEDVNTKTQINALMIALNAYLAEIMSNVPDGAGKLTAIKTFTRQELLSVALFSVVLDPSLTLQERQMARITGVVLVIVSCVGYLANPLLVFHNVLEWNWLPAIFITALPMCFLGVLFTYFGDTMGQRIWADIKADARYIYRCFAKDPENPPVFLQTPIFKLYPTIALACMVLNIFLAIFSAAAAMEMIHYAFSDYVSENGLLALYVFAQVGVSIVAVYAPLDYQKMLMTYYALYLDKGICHDIMMLHEGIAALQGDVYRLKSPSEEYTDVEEDAESKRTNLWCSSWPCGRQGQENEMRERLLATI